MDLGPSSLSCCELSVSVLLSPLEDYEGGELDFLHASSQSRGVAQGAVVFLPSCMARRVVPVAHGVRRSLVAWGYGSCFR